jgi:hypothetical protein
VSTKTLENLYAQLTPAELFFASSWPPWSFWCWWKKPMVIRHSASPAACERLGPFSFACRRAKTRMYDSALAGLYWNLASNYVSPSN